MTTTYQPGDLVTHLRYGRLGIVNRPAHRGNRVRILWTDARIPRLCPPDELHPLEPTDLGRIIWDTSHHDEGTISYAGANIVARAILAAFRGPR